LAQVASALCLGPVCIMLSLRGWSDVSSSELSAFVSGTHPRLGRDSSVLHLARRAGDDVLRIIAGYVLRPARPGLIAQGASLRWLDMDARKCSRSFTESNDDSAAVSTISAVAVDWTHKQALTGLENGSLRLWDLDLGVCIKPLVGHVSGSSITNVDVDWASRVALSCSCDNTIKLWDMDTGLCIRSFDGHTKSVQAMSADWERRRILSGSEDCQLKLWDIDTGACIWSIDAPKHNVHEVVADWTKGQALTAGGDCVKLWDLSTGMEVRRFAGEGKTCTFAHTRHVAVNWSWRMVLTDTFDTACCLNTLRLWELDTSRCLMSFMGPFGSVYSIAVDWENKEVLTSGKEGLKLWDMEQGASLQLQDDFATKGDHRMVLLKC